MKHLDETWEEFCLRSKRIILVGIARGWIYPELHNQKNKHGTQKNEKNRKRNNLLQPQRIGESTEVQSKDRDG